MGTSTKQAETAGVILDGDVEFKSLVKWTYTSHEEGSMILQRAYQLKRILFTLKQSPAFVEESWGNYMLISLPQYAYLTQKPIEEIGVLYLMVWVKDHNRGKIDVIAEDLES